MIPFEVLSELNYSSQLNTWAVLQMVAAVCGLQARRTYEIEEIGWKWLKRSVYSHITIPETAKIKYF